MGTSAWKLKSGPQEQSTGIHAFKYYRRPKSGSFLAPMLRPARACAHSELTSCQPVGLSGSRPRTLFLRPEKLLELELSIRRIIYSHKLHTVRRYGLAIRQRPLPAHSSEKCCGLEHRGYYKSLGPIFHKTSEFHHERSRSSLALRLR